MIPKRMIFSKRGGSKFVWNFFKNSSILVSSLSVLWIGGMSENVDNLEKISSTVNTVSSVGKIAMPVIYQH